MVLTYAPSSSSAGSHISPNLPILCPYRWTSKGQEKHSEHVPLEPEQGVEETFWQCEEEQREQILCNPAHSQNVQNLISRDVGQHAAS